VKDTNFFCHQTWPAAIGNLSDKLSDISPMSINW